LKRPGNPLQSVVRVKARFQEKAWKDTGSPGTNRQRILLPPINFAGFSDEKKELLEENVYPDTGGFYVIRGKHFWKKCRLFFPKVTLSG
jgi:hypothetical protein